jgi:hypothetical protein
VAVDFFGHPGVGVGVVAQRPQLLAAEETAAARDRERHDDAVADFQLLVVLADFDDFAHELVAEDVSRLHRRNVAIEQVQIRSADRRGGDLDDGVSAVEDRRIGDAFYPDVVGRVPD